MMRQIIVAVVIVLPLGCAGDYNTEDGQVPPAGPPLSDLGPEEAERVLCDAAAEAVRAVAEGDVASALDTMRHLSDYPLGRIEDRGVRAAAMPARDMAADVQVIVQGELDPAVEAALLNGIGDLDDACIAAGD